MATIQASLRRRKLTVAAAESCTGGLLRRRGRARARLARAPRREDRPRRHRHRRSGWRDAGETGWPHVRRRRQRQTQRGEKVRVDLRSRGQPPRERRRRAGPAGGRHRMIELGRVWTDDQVAALYRYRAPYPRGIFDILERLAVEPRVVLDAGAGTGALARNFPPAFKRIDAVDPSTAMIARGRSLPGGY